MFDRSWTVVLPGNAGPAVTVLDNVTLPDDGEREYELEAWDGISQAGNTIIFADDITLPEAQARMSQPGKLDCVMVVSAAAPSRVRIPSDIPRRLTIFNDSAVAGASVVTIRIRQKS